MKFFPSRVLRLRRASNRPAFTLLQLLTVIAVIVLLAAILFPVFARSRMAARRATCDVRLKAIALALDAYRQENGHYPLSLEELRNNKYLRDPDALRCPSDPRQGNEATYDDYYIVRAARDENDLPIVTCPFHEEENGMGAQAYKGRYTTQFAAMPAHIESAMDTRVWRPGKQPIAAAAGMGLHGGDRIIVGARASALPSILPGGLLGNLVSTSGQAVITFADGSSATLYGGSDVTVLQSFVMGHEGAPLYTVVKQKAGEVEYNVNHGSHFDVATPTATAGARGTHFTVTIKADGTTKLYVENGRVLFTGVHKSVMATANQTVDGLLNGLFNLL